MPTASTRRSTIARRLRRQRLLHCELLEDRRMLAFSVIGSDVYSAGGFKLVAHFSDPVDATTVNAADLVLDSVAATGVNVLDADSLEFTFATPAAGSHSATIAGGAIKDSLGTNLDAFSTTFDVASAAQFTVKHNPRLQPGNAPLVGFAGSELDRVDILWQTIPGGIGTQDTFTVESRAVGATAWLSAPLNATIATNIEERVVWSASITGLNWNSDYEYRVRHLRADVIVTEYQSDFRTRLAAGDASSFSFAAYGDSASGAAAGFRQVQARINQVDPSFSVLLGDNIYNVGSHVESDARFDPIVNPEAAAWMAGKIDYLGLGNHDVGTMSGLPSEQNFSVPVPVAGVTAPVAPPAGERAEHSYSWDYGDVHFVTFDTNSLHDPVRLNGLLNWAVADLSASSARWKIVYGHHPVGGVPDKPESASDNYYQQVINRLKAAGVDLFMTGHSHTYGWSYPLTGQINGTATFADHGEDDHFHAGEGVPQLVSGMGGKDIRPGTFTQFPFVAEGFSSQTPVPSRFGFAKVDVTPDLLTVSYVAADDGSVIDSFEIEKEVTRGATFQQGTSGYAGTVDTVLQQNTPTANNGAATSLSVDGDDPGGSGFDVQSLLRFENIFGNGAAQIPTNVTLRTATLQLNVTNSSPSNMNLHRMLTAWSATDTWNSRAGGIQLNGAEASALPDTSSGSAAIGRMSFNVLASLQAWQNNPATNLGWAFVPTGNDGIDFDSSEGAIRPKLIVTWVGSNVNDSPEGSDRAITMGEDANHTLIAAGFGFSDPLDSPANTLASVRIVSLPALGSLTLNNVAVTANQNITVANINAGLLRFTPALNASSSPYTSFRFQVRDNGGIANGGVNLDPSPNMLAFNVTPVNDAPVLNIALNPALPQIAEDTANPAGGLVQTLVDNEATDVDIAALKGVAVTGLSNTSQGTWEYKLDAGSQWTEFGTVTSAAARLLPAGARVRFIPRLNFNGQVRMFYRAWDQTQTSVDGVFNLSQPSSVGGSTAFSLASEFATLNVLLINDAPLLKTPLQPQLAPIAEGEVDSAGTLVRDLIAGTVIEPDSNPLFGIAVIGAVSGFGRWEYSLSGGGFLPLTSASASTSRLLPADATTRVRFVPTNLNYNGAVRFNYRLWDQTQGTPGGEFNLVGPGKLGGRTAFSFNVEVATQVITAVNDAPALTNLGGSIGYVRNNPARLVSPNAIVSDVDSPLFTGGELRVRISQGALAGNVLAIGGAFTFQGSNVLLNGTHIGTLNTNAGQGTTPLVVTFTANATRGIAQQLTRAITFRTTGAAGPRTLLFSLTDNAGASTGELSKSVIVT